MSASCVTLLRSCRSLDRDYLLPFATRSRFLFKMDFAEAEYICAAALRRQRPLQLPQDRLADEGKNGRSSSRSSAA